MVDSVDADGGSMGRHPRSRPPQGRARQTVVDNGSCGGAPVMEVVPWRRVVRKCLGRGQGQGRAGEHDCDQELLHFLALSNSWFQSIVFGPVPFIALSANDQEFVQETGT